MQIIINIFRYHRHAALSHTSGLHHILRDGRKRLLDTLGKALTNPRSKLHSTLQFSTFIHSNAKALSGTMQAYQTLHRVTISLQSFDWSLSSIAFGVWRPATSTLSKWDSVLPRGDDDSSRTTFVWASLQFSLENTRGESIISSFQTSWSYKHREKNNTFYEVLSRRYGR